MFEQQRHQEETVTPSSFPGQTDESSETDKVFVIPGMSLALQFAAFYP